MNYSLNDILLGTLSIYFDKGFELPDLDQKTITLSKKQMQHYVGNYTNDQIAMGIKVFVEKQQLMAQASGQRAFPLTANSETKLRFDPAGLVMIFDSLSSGKYQEFALKQSGGEILFKRK